MTTRLVNNVFQIVSDGGVSTGGIRFVSNTNVSSNHGTGVGESTNKNSSFSGTKVSATTSFMMIGSGVGTEYYDDLDLPNKPQAFRLEKKSSGGLANPYAMQVRVDKDEGLPV
jgi:hypothetical protein